MPDPVQFNDDILNEKARPIASACLDKMAAELDKDNPNLDKLDTLAVVLNAVDSQIVPEKSEGETV